MKWSLLPRRRPGAAGSLLLLAHLLLLAWAAGLAVTAFQLADWRQELSRTLLQLNADAQFRARVASRDAVDPAWYRRKALSLLAAAERLQRDTSWTLFVPGSWHLFDDLEEQVQARIEREFGEIVVETIRRDLQARTSQLTGVPLLPASGELKADADCRPPAPAVPATALSAAPEDLPEYGAIASYLATIEPLDRAVHSFIALQSSGGTPAQLRELVAYSLGAELPGTLGGSVQLFRQPAEADVQPALFQARLQWATRCTLYKAMGALHQRLLRTNALFTLEQALAQRSAGLFDAGSRAVPFQQALERYRAVRTLLDDQHALLARGRNDWMRHASLQLGPAYEDLLARIARTGLFGPEVLQRIGAQSGAAFAQFRKQFEAAFGQGSDPGIVWLEAEQRFGLSPGRAGLREGLQTLLQAPFMTDDSTPAGGAVRTAASLDEVLLQARDLAAARSAFLEQGLPRFPEAARPAVQRMVDARVADLIYEEAFRTLRHSLPQDPALALHPDSFRLLHRQAAELQGLLREAGGGSHGQRLVAAVQGELQRRLAVLEGDWRAQPFYDSRAVDFSDWQGDPLSLANRVGADGASLGRLAARLETVQQQAATLFDLGGSTLRNDPAAARWQALQAELGRYQARRADSSLLRLERYLQDVGPDLTRDNCGERLAAVRVERVAGDDIAARHLVLHRALVARCGELAAQRARPAVAPLEAPAAEAWPVTAPPAAPATAPLPAILPPPVLLRP